MIPSKREQLKVEGNLSGQVIGMSIDKDSIYHIMDVLANLYSDPIYAVVREYSTNALDSHIEAGVKDPIKLQMPTTLSPFMYIQDFGMGLDAADIENIYSKYGLSTKTDTNDQTGSLGLGSKSALAYTSQFTLIGIKHGVSTTVAVGRDEEGVGTMTIVDKSPSNDHNGVTIMIPVKDGDAHRFENSARRLFKYWPAGSVLINDEPPARLEGGLKVNDEISLMEGTGRYDQWTKQYANSAPHVIIMGAVPYPIDPQKFDFNFSGRYQVVAHVPMGSLHFTPSRDQLNYTKKTFAKLEEIRETIKSTLLKSINTEINAAKSRPEALKVAIRWRQALPKAFENESFEYRGIKMPESIVVPESGYVFLVAEGRSGDRPGSYSRMQAIDLVAVPEAIWIYNFNRSFTPTVKKKLRYYTKSILLRAYPAQFICCNFKPTSPWIEPENIVDWDPIEAIKLPRTVNGRTVTHRKPLSYDVLTHSNGQSDWDHEILLEDIPTDIPTFTSTSGSEQSVKQSARQIGLIIDNFQIVSMTSNRTDKFHRLRPDSSPWQDALRESYRTWCDSLTDLEKDILAYHELSGGDWYHALKALPARGIDDPDIRRLRHIANVEPEYLHHLSGILGVFQSAHCWSRTDFAVDNPLDRYPLINDDVDSQYDYERHRRTTRYRHKLHNKIYVNAIFHHSKES